jgi:hypothetical protein
MVCGHCPPYVSSNTLAFGVYLPNTLDENNLGQDPDSNWTSGFAAKTSSGLYRSYGLFSVRRIEELTGYNFFSNIQTDIQEKIETLGLENEVARITTIRNRVNAIQPAPLMAEQDLRIEPVISTTEGTMLDSSIWESSFPNKISLATDTFSVSSFSSFEIGLSQNGVANVLNKSFAKISTSSIDMNQFSALKISFTQSTPSQIGSTQVGIFDDSSFQNGHFQVSSEQIGSSQVGKAQIGKAQIGSTQVDISQNSSLQFNSILSASIGSSWRGQQFNSSKVTFTNSIPFQQLSSSNLPSHDLPSNYLTQLQSALATDWHLPTDLNITFNITDLPAGQLAEGTITGYDTNGRPNGGTLTLDTDGNSLGWFIDTTPDDNTEFDQNLTTTAFRATTGTAAGKYDILTTILHELGHLQGIISGNTAFDTSVQNINGIPTFIENGITATLTPDGTIHKSDKVTITALTNNSSIVTIDLTQIAPATQATLYFNLLGFGAKTSTVTYALRRRLRQRRRETLHRHPTHPRHRERRR